MDNPQRIKLMTEALQTLSPSHLEVIDESYKHIGHEGAKSGKGHFKVIIQSQPLEDKTRLAAHKAIYTALGSLMETEIHALSIVLKK